MGKFWGKYVGRKQLKFPEVELVNKPNETLAGQSIKLYKGKSPSNSTRTERFLSGRIILAWRLKISPPTKRKSTKAPNWMAMLGACKPSLLGESEWRSLCLILKPPLWVRGGVVLLETGKPAAEEEIACLQQTPPKRSCTLAWGWSGSTKHQSLWTELRNSLKRLSWAFTATKPEIQLGVKGEQTRIPLGALGNRCISSWVCLRVWNEGRRSSSLNSLK